jgi:hypothetical protein
MAQQTPNRSYPYPDGIDMPYAALDFQNLATAIDTDMAAVIAALTPQDHMGTVATRPGTNIGAAFGFTDTGNPKSQGVLFATRACTVSVQFAIDFTGAANASCTMQVQYAINNGALVTPLGGSSPTGPLVGGDNPRLLIPADIQLAAGDSLSLNASMSAVVGSLSWYAPTFTYTARAAVHV